MKPAVALLALALLPGCDLDVYEAEREVASALIDPDSARFDNVTKQMVDGRPLVCGMVNGKNRFGAMAGARAFMYRAPLMRIADEEGEDGEILLCCRFLREMGTIGSAKTTADLAACEMISPPMPL